MKSQSPCDLEVREIIVENESDLEREKVRQKINAYSRLVRMTVSNSKCMDT